MSLDLPTWIAGVVGVVAAFLALAGWSTGSWLPTLASGGILTALLVLSHLRGW